MGRAFQTKGTDFSKNFEQDPSYMFVYVPGGYSETQMSLSGLGAIY